MKLVYALTIYIAAIVAANAMTAHLGLVPVGFGLMVTAGTFAAGFALLARDAVHATGGIRWGLGAIIVGAILSWLLASPAIALASLAAFSLAELADLAVYVRLRKHGFVKAAFLSNCVGAPIDTIVFLAIAGFPLTWQVITGQLIGKLVWATILPLLIYVGVRHQILRKSVNTERSCSNV